MKQLLLKQDWVEVWAEEPLPEGEFVLLAPGPGCQWKHTFQVKDGETEWLKSQPLAAIDDVEGEYNAMQERNGRASGQ